jgi:hypothetical protein
MEGAEHRVTSRSGDRSSFERYLHERPTSVHEALAALNAVTAWLADHGDQRAAFPDIYGIITRRVAESVALGADGFFLEPRWISRLAGRFCERYLETLRWSLDAGAQDTGAWSIAYACCDLGDMLPVHHVILGLSAHINYDLALGIAATIAELGGADDPAQLARYKHDHDAVNCLLRASVPEAFDHLIERHACPASKLIYRHAYGVAEWVAMYVLTTWRERVWADAIEMLHATTPAARDKVKRRLERRSRRFARLLAIPGIVPVPAPPVEGDAPRDAARVRHGRAEQWLHALS